MIRSGWDCKVAIRSVLAMKHHEMTLLRCCYTYQIKDQKAYSVFTILILRWLLSNFIISSPCFQFLLGYLRFSSHTLLQFPWGLWLYLCGKETLFKLDNSATKYHRRGMDWQWHCIYCYPKLIELLRRAFMWPFCPYRRSWSAGIGSQLSW